MTIITTMFLVSDNFSTKISVSREKNVASLQNKFKKTIGDTYVCVCVCVCVYIERERQRERERSY